MEDIDERQVRLWWNTMKEDGQLVEIRVLADKKVYSGYFRDVETLIEAIKPYSNFNCYYTLNMIKDDCDSREQHNKMVLNPKSTTNDKEIIRRDYVLLDFDSKRSSNTNASNEELEYTKKRTNDLYKFLLDNGFEGITVLISANGTHTILPCALPNDDESNNMIERFTKTLSFMFSDSHAEVDISVFNPARIARLPGSYSRKGTHDSETRPQRKCVFVKYSDERKINKRDYFQKIADLYPEPEKPSYSNNFKNESFDLDAFLTQYNIQINSIEKVNGGTKYILDHCVFDENHKAKDAMIFRADNGALSYVCFHNSCSKYTWKDVRLKFQPDAYSKRDYSEFQRKMPYYGSPYQFREAFKPKEETDELGKKWLSLSDIKYIDTSKLPTIPTGFNVIDRTIGGLILGEMSVVSGSNASGKSSWLNCLALNAIEKGWKTAIWSGELVSYRLKGWINQACAGKSYIAKKDGYDNMYYVPSKTSEKIDAWTRDKLFIYNNEYGSMWQQLLSDIKEAIHNNGIKLVIIDNLMALNLDGIDGDNNSKQKNFILDISSLAKKEQIHIIIVAHPRKEVSFLRKESISGSGDIVNLADNLFIIHRVNMDFQTRGKEFFGEAKVNSCMDYGNVLEIAKSRSTGVCDFLVGFYYELETRRFKNTVSEHINYGWMEYDPQMSINIENTDNEKITSNESDDDEDNNQYYERNDFGVYDDLREEEGECPF